jgi:peptide/nickel transport system permease protein
VADSLRSLPLGSIAILGTLAVLAVFGHQIAPFDPLEIQLSRALQPPILFGGNWPHVMGTDELGRDVLSRLIIGAGVSVRLALASLVLGGGLGTVIGLVSGYAAGRLDRLLMVVTDLVLSYPIILFALLLAVKFGAQESNVIFAVGLVLWTRFARVVRGDVLIVREQGYVVVARATGASAFRIVLRHILPNVASTILVLASLNVGFAILTEASLSFLGAGVPPPQPVWGSMVGLGARYAFTAWWIPTMPALAIMMTVLALNLLGDWMRDKFDVRLKLDT